MLSSSANIFLAERSAMLVTILLLCVASGQEQPDGGYAPAQNQSAADFAISEIALYADRGFGWFMDTDMQFYIPEYQYIDNHVNLTLDEDSLESLMKRYPYMIGAETLSNIKVNEEMTTLTVVYLDRKPRIYVKVTPDLDDCV